MVGAILGAVGGLAGLAGNLVNQFAGGTQASTSSSMTIPQQIALAESLGREWKRAPDAIKNLKSNIQDPGNEYNQLRNWRSDFNDVRLTAKENRNSVLGRIGSELHPTQTQALRSRFKTRDINRLGSMSAEMEMKEGMLKDIANRSSVDRALGVSVKSLGLLNGITGMNLGTNVITPQNSIYSDMAAVGNGLGGLSTSLSNLVNEFRVGTTPYSSTGLSNVAQSGIGMVK